MAIATAIPFIAEDFELSPLAMGGVMSAFFIGYAVMQIPGGLLADRFGSRRVMTAAVAAWSVFTGLTGAATSLPILLGIRVLFGVAEGPYPPSAAKAIALAFPQNEIGRANGIQLASVNIGAAIAPLVVAPLLVAFGWRWVFCGLMMPGLVLALMVWRTVRDSDDGLRSLCAPAVTVAERVSLMQAVRSPAVGWCCVSIFFANIASWGLMNWLPTYLLQGRGFGVLRAGIMTSLPFLSGAVGYYLGGYLLDKYFYRCRHILISLSLVLSAVLTYVAAVAVTGELAVAALVAVFLCLFVALGGIFTVPLVLVSSEAVGKVFGIVNASGQAAAFLSPLLVGYLLQVTNQNFTWMFYLIGGLFLVSSCAAMRMRVPHARDGRAAIGTTC